MPDEAIEQRCARIRGRMQWILDQLGEGEAVLPLPSKHAAELEHQAQLHHAAMADELERQARRLQAEHEAEMRRHLAQIRAVHSTEVSGLRAQLTSAREDAAQQRYEAERAASECAIEVERERVEREAAQRGELARMRSRNSLLEAALGKVCLREVFCSAVGLSLEVESGGG